MKDTKSVTSFGSEFKETIYLKELFGLHPRWKELKSRLEDGVSFPIVELDKDYQSKDLEAAYKRGNHKSAEANEEFLSKALIKEIEKGWTFVLPDEKYNEILNLVLNPMGVALQLGVSATGEFVEKRRLTHYMSFPGKFSNESVNSRVIKEILEPCMFGHTLLRVIHQIVAIRKRHKSSIIWIRKEDFKSTYCRMHLDALTAVRAAVRVKLNGSWFILTSTRLPFGGSPCPNDFSLASDMITDAVNDLLCSKDWDHKKVVSDFVKSVPAPKPLDEDIPFAQARELCVDIPENDCGKADCFIDDIITVAVDLGNNAERIAAAPCTVLHSVAHKCIGNIHVKRDNIISDDKNEAKGAPEETKICLGWLLDTRRLLVSLPYHKFKAWTSQIDNILDKKSASGETLESVIGRLENIAIIIPMLGHFFNNIRFLHQKASHKKHNVKLTRQAKDDLSLSKSFLIKAHKGVSMNLLVFCKPDIIHIGDASEHGLGAFASHGRAWRFNIPKKIRGRAHINLLEFLTQVVSIWIDIIKGKAKDNDCILCMGDSTSAMGWL